MASVKQPEPPASRREFPARAALILAAGASERMGAPKALLPWGNSTLLGSALEQARLAGVQRTIVVLGPATRHVEPQLPEQVQVLINPEPNTGRSASIRIASQALTDEVSGILIQSVDQPCPAEVLELLFEAVDKGAILAVPAYRGRRGHPICVSRRLLPELRSTSEADQGLRAVVRRHAHDLIEVAVNSEWVTWNLNDPRAYAAARAAAERP